MRSITDEADSSLLKESPPRRSSTMALWLAMTFPGLNVEGLRESSPLPSPWSDVLNIDWGDELRKAAASASVCRAEPTALCWLLCVASSPDPVEEVPDQEIIYRTVGSNSTCI